LLHCVVVGGGPTTGVEFSGELSDIIRDIKQRYSHVKDYIHVTLIEVWSVNFLVSVAMIWFFISGK
jgi:NADH dehydrogenase FAD-containing subunit